MKKKFNNLNEILAFDLEAMYVAEKKIQRTLTDCIKKIAVKKLKNEFRKYQQSAADKRLKLKRVFAYLLVRPSDRKSKPIAKMLAELTAVSASKTCGELKDVQFLSTLRTVTHYKVAMYANARTYSDVLALTSVSDLLAEIIEWENNTYHSLGQIGVENVNLKAGKVGME
ncbi:hypothetical protein BH09BAC3_BH09BAC3_14210 [soil metagenome]